MQTPPTTPRKSGNVNAVQSHFPKTERIWWETTDGFCSCCKEKIPWDLRYYVTFTPPKMDDSLSKEENELVAWKPVCEECECEE